MGDDFAKRLDRMEDRRQIEEVIYLYCRAIDRNDLDLFRSVFWEDGGYGGGVRPGVAKDFAEPMMAALKAKYESTQHSIANILMDLRDEIAFVESTATAYHKSLPTPESNASMLGPAWLEDESFDKNASHDLIVGLRYVDRFEKRFGAWRIALRNLVFDWSQVQPSNNKDFGALNPPSLRGVRGRGDFSYKLP